MGVIINESRFSNDYIVGSDKSRSKNNPCTRALVDPREGALNDNVSNGCRQDNILLGIGL